MGWGAQEYWERPTEKGPRKAWALSRESPVGDCGMPCGGAEMEPAVQSMGWGVRPLL